MRRLTAGGVVRAVAVLCMLSASALADESSRDVRLGPLKDLNGYFPFEPPADLQAWEAQAAQRRQAIRVALGLWPLPQATPLNSVVHGLRDLGDYTVEKVYFESLPGFYVTGNLYRPRGFTGRRPAVLCPHGHFTDGRFGDAGAEAAARERAQGAEPFENGGRNQIQARCAHLARMGCIVFNYDMIGYCDSEQISFDLAHRFATQRPQMIGTQAWGFFSPQAEAMLQSIMGLQTYNSIRALDWITSLPDVDATRIAVTGASGGGTQTFILGAIDPRPAVLVPAVMVSTGMQGGCTCENASLLRIGTGNVEFAALIAPRPLCLISADDWTREMATKGFPELERLYGLHQASARLEHHPYLQFGHNYNGVSRAAMYQFLHHQLGLAGDEPLAEQEFTRLTREELTVWDADHPKPAGGADFEQTLLARWAQDATDQIAATRPQATGSMRPYRELVGSAWQTLIRRQVPTADRVQFVESDKQAAANHWVFRGSVEHRAGDADPAIPDGVERVPVICLVPKEWNQHAVAIWLDGQGAEGLFAEQSPRLEVQRLLDRGVAVIGVDLLEQGQQRSESEDGGLTRRVNNDRESAAYTLGYNDALFTQRVHDVLTVIGFAVHHERAPQQVWLVGLGEAGPWAAVARAIAREHVDRAAIETQGFRFLAIDSIRHPSLLPGGAKYDDLLGPLALAAPHPTWLGGESPDSAPVVAAAYERTGARSSLVWGSQMSDPIEWLIATGSPERAK